MSVWISSTEAFCLVFLVIIVFYHTLSFNGLCLISEIGVIQIYQKMYSSEIRWHQTKHMCVFVRVKDLRKGSLLHCSLLKVFNKH